MMGPGGPDGPDHPKRALCRLTSTSSLIRLARSWLVHDCTEAAVPDCP
jgi:hypothetical protein